MMMGKRMRVVCKDERIMVITMIITLIKRSKRM